jgi:hypothetical protein
MAFDTRAIYVAIYCFLQHSQIMAIKSPLHSTPGTGCFNSGSRPFQTFPPLNIFGAPITFEALVFIPKLLNLSHDAPLSVGLHEGMLNLFHRNEYGSSLSGQVNLAPRSYQHFVKLPRCWGGV